MNVDALIDAFVRKINQSPRRRIREEDIPFPLREGGAEFGLYYDWTIQRSDAVNWIEPLEALLPALLPPSYRSLVSRYLFPAFDIPPIMLLANTGEALYNEMGTVMTRDKVLSHILLRNGFAQFARPSSGDSDPVCFACLEKSADGECPIVRVSHHALIFSSAVHVTHDIAGSFREFVNDFVRTEPEEIKL